MEEYYFLGGQIRHLTILFRFDYFHNAKLPIIILIYD